ncbi:MAG: tRNA uridine-5-carboxymethylaminomethyl(34) synthesis enzyme MnmG [Bacteroidaceae bacterium]|nr:tRNA uridine-5-carboxymethylaminomethyl(34) synthesis enzyme MnmG [Bacteroidaceae bacterium]
MRYDVIVIGAGHAGCEAASAAANLGSKTLLITMDMNKIGQMSCNPAVGGIAKGQIVREIDALGGQMGIVTDMSSIQFRMLNMSKGPAMWSPRAQCDRTKFIDNWRKVLDNIPNLYIWQDCVTKLSIINNVVTGVECGLGVSFESKCVILTAGTFLNGLMHVGKCKFEGGRISEYSSYGLTEQLNDLGFKSDRMKTGTPMRIDGRTIDFSKMQRQDGDNESIRHFSFLPDCHNSLKQRPCWITYTNNATHDILRSGLKDSPLYNGQIKSIGPRYCPSIETKIVTFAEKEQHQLFIEPEGETSEEYYVNGFSSSLPMDVQFEAIHTVPGLENVVAYRPGYAIEYDFFDPTQLHHTLETKLVRNLYFAGQVNGTTGYEEAAGQGLVAGINAHQRCVGGEDFVLSRSESYIGVLIDDLVNKGVDEPYRMFTSRAEYRILLRQDDADMRLTEKSYRLGLATEERYNIMCKKRKAIADLIEFCKDYSLRANEVNDYLSSVGSSLVDHTIHLYDLVLRPQVSLTTLLHYCEIVFSSYSEEIIEAAEIQIKYSGYIAREKQLADKLARLDYIKIPSTFDYSAQQSLSTEARQKLTRIRPLTIGDASRIPGVSPNDVSVLLMLLGR